MRTKTYQRNDSSFIVEELQTKKEFNEFAKGIVNDIIDGYDEDGDFSVYIEYADGTNVYIADWLETPEQKFTSRGMVFGVISNPATQQVYGKYNVDEYGNVQTA